MTTDFETARSQRAPALEALSATLGDKGVEFLQTHLLDVNGAFRTKLTPFKLATQGEAVNCNFFCVTHGEGAPLLEPLFFAEVSNEGNGFPNMRGLIDPASVRHHAWTPQWASAIVDSFEIDGKRNPLDARAILLRQQQRAEAMGFEAKFALEYEFGIFERDEEKMRQGRYRELSPWGTGDINYSIMRSRNYQIFFGELIRRLKSIDVGMSSVTTEYGYGMYEYALSPKPPLEAADDALRTKLAVQELCLEHGLTATFMARFQPMGQHSACGAHHHQSLWRDGRNVFSGPNGGISQIGRHYVGGLLRHLPASHLVFRPTINSYRRFDTGAWSPTAIGWGHEDRTRSIRAITIPTPDAVRFEHRVPGADINPYLTVTAMLAAGLDGIEAGIDPDLLVACQLPSTLEASIERFRDDAFISETFGSAFQKHFVASRQSEADAFQAWLDRQVTDFEFQRYFVAL